MEEEREGWQRKRHLLKSDKGNSILNKVKKLIERAPDSEDIALKKIIWITIIVEEDLEKTYTKKVCIWKQNLLYHSIVQIIYRETATSVSLPVSSAEYVLPLLLSWILNYINAELFSYIIIFLFTDCSSVAPNIHIQYIFQSLIYLYFVEQKLWRLGLEELLFHTGRRQVLYCFGPDNVGRGRLPKWIFSIEQISVLTLVFSVL